MIYYFHPQAEGEHLETIQYYESRRMGLGADYLQEFERLMVRVAERPSSFRLERQPDIRRVSLIRFPYKVIYRVAQDSIQILAVSQKRRRPGYWANRV